MEIACYIILGILTATCIGLVIALMSRKRAPQGPSDAEIESRIRSGLAEEREAMLKRQEHYFDSMLAETENRFRALSQKIFEDRSERLKREGTEHLNAAIAPLLRDIKAFREKMELINDAALKQSGKMEEKIKMLAETTNTVSAQANELANAIRGEAQVTGAWGEIQLRRVLDLAGLVEGVDYTYQETFASAESLRRDLRTDVLVKISRDKYFVIDSKNTMDAYVDYASGDESKHEDAKRKIVESLKNHVDEMKSAAYQKNIKQAFDYAFMYIPFEEVYLIAMKEEVKVCGERILLREYARNANIIFVNATSLLPTLHLVSATWARQESDKKAEKIREACEALCDKVETFLCTYEKLGKAMAKLADDYNNGLKQLSTGNGNIIKRLHSFEEYKIKSAEKLPSDESYAENGLKAVEKALALQR
ncbi:MAG: DNA recombination protein RmuC [Lentisphaerae bacterium]|nr:DNA recombination protein RmuC [Lentisphaerota bacterium]